MTGSSNDRRSISASMSGAPSLVNSLNSFSSSSKLNINQAQIKSPPEQSFVEIFLEKAKFYTSLCLGKCADFCWINICNGLNISFFNHIFLIRYVSHIICICIFIFDTIRGGSCDNNNSSRLWPHTSYLYSCRPYVCQRDAQLFMELVPWRLHNCGNTVSFWKISFLMKKKLISSCIYNRCHQLLVNYTKIPWHDWLENPNDLEKIDWDVGDTKLLINSEGCGYPPHVNCTEFAKKYG